ncbi:ABC transporter substrate-binding protein [Leeia oryzae]|uniref:ABC transporter substrate-binding protein n=1 Tax=Leeia oryzae TaxID=356662 RepID=UPI00037CEB12|nr:ABC transporter substrate-binding protein [Leeia oryzae]
MKRIRCVLLVMLCLSASMAMARRIEVGVTSWIGTAPLNVADVKGYWTEQGLDVHLVKYADYSVMFKDFRAKKLDLMYDMTGTWVDLYQQGYPITILAETDWSNGGDKLIVKNTLTDFQKLKGQTIGIYLSRSSVTYLLDKFLKSHGLKLADVKLTELDGEPLAKAFIQNKFPLVLLYDPPALLARNNGNGHVEADSASYPGVMPEGFAIHNDSKAELGTETLSRFFTGWMKGRQWISETNRWSEFEKILNQRTFAGEKPYASLDLIGMLNSIKFHSRTALQQRNQPDGGMTVYLNELKQFLKENGKLQKNFDQQQLVDTSALMLAIKRIDTVN